MIDEGNPFDLKLPYRYSYGMNNYHIDKKNAMLLHKMLWNTMADKILEWKRPVEKWEIFELYGWPKIYGNCWCCEYVKQNCWESPYFNSCLMCPIEWGKNKGCMSYGTPYSKWFAKMGAYIYRSVFTEKEITELASLAKQIANLPEKE